MIYCRSIIMFSLNAVMQFSIRTVHICGLHAKILPVMRANTTWSLWVVICQVSVVLKEILQLIQTKSYYNPDRDFILQNKIQKHSITMHGITERQWHFAYLRLNTVIIKARNMVKCLSFKTSTTNLYTKFTINLYLIRWHQRWLSLINQI